MQRRNIYRRICRKVISLCMASRVRENGSLVTETAWPPLCEMRRKNFSEMSTDDAHKVYISGEEDRHEYGVGFLVHKDIASAVLGCRPVSSRLISRVGRKILRNRLN